MSGSPPDSALAVGPAASQGTVRTAAVVTAAGALYLLFATTTGFGWIDSWHDEQRAMQIVLFGLVALGLARLALAGGRSAWPPASAAVPAVLALGIVSASAAPFPGEGMAEVALFALLCGEAALAAWFVRTVRAPARVVERAALFIAAAHVAGAAVRYAAALETGTALGTEIWMLGFSNPRVASAFYALLIPFLALATLPEVETDRRLRLAGWAGLVAVWAIAAGLQARALWFSYAVAVAAVVLLLPSPLARRLSLTLVLTALAGVAVQWLLPLPEGAAAAPSRDLLSLSAREVLWRLAWDTVLAHPLLGIGPGGFAHLSTYVGAHPHNWALQLASEWGLPALLIVLAGLSACALRMRRQMLHGGGDGALLLAAGYAVLVGLASALVDGSLVMPTTQVAFALAFGLMLGSAGAVALPATSAPRSSGARAGAALVAVVAVLAAGWIAVQAVTTYRGQEDERAAFRQRFPGKWLVPRFWESGLKLAAPAPPTARR